MDGSMPGFPVLHYLLEVIKLMSTESDAIQPPYPWSSPSPPAFNLSQHQKDISSKKKKQQIYLKLPGWLNLSLWHPTPVLLPGKSHGRRSLHWRRKWQPTPVFLPGESPGTGQPGALPSMGSQRVGHDWSDLAAAAAAYFFRAFYSSVAVLCVLHSHTVPVS